MEKISLGSQGLEVSQLGLGCMGISEFYGDASEEQNIATLNRSLELGIGFVAYSPLGRGFLTGTIGSREELSDND